jgi:hypothetical protein
MNKKIIIIAVFIIVCAGFLVLFSKKVSDVTIERPSVTIHERTIFVALARTPDEQRQGLSGMSILPENEGMLFLFGERENIGFWMKDMNFPIDIVWISGHAVVGVEKNIDPQIGVGEEELKVYYPPEPVDRVLEINAGKADEWGITRGNTLVFSE